MKHRGITKRISALFLTAAVVVTMLPKLTTSAFAQGTGANGLPSVTQFATAEELKSFDTNDQNGHNPARVYFGNNTQQWWIAGSQQANGLTLFATSPLAELQKFELNHTQNKQYNLKWNCDYTSTGGSTPTEVYPNHYGASPLRTILKGLETSYFTDAEQGLMNKTTVYTNDTKNSSIYSTTDKLYLAYGEYGDDKHITVGTNDQGSLNNGLRVDMDYWGRDAFWLRAPVKEASYCALVAQPGYYVVHSYGNFDYPIVPAFELNLSSVKFASAIPSVTSEGTFTNSDAFTLRYDATAEKLGSAFVPCNKTKVQLTNVPSGTYLVAQNSAGAKAKQITNETEVTASAMGLPTFENCKVWLERTDSASRISYATLATEEEAVASVVDSQGNKQYYASLEEAFNKANANDTVILLKTIEHTKKISVSKNLTLDLNGQILNLVGDSAKIYIEDKSVHFNIINEKNGDIKNAEAVEIHNFGILTTKGSISCNILTSEDSIIMDGTYSGSILNRGIIENGSFLGDVVSDVGSTIKNGYFAETSSVRTLGTIEGGQYKGENLFYGTVNGGDFYSQVTLESPGDPYKAVINGGNFAKEPILKNGAAYGDGKILLKTNNTDFPYKAVTETDTVTLEITLGQNITNVSGSQTQKVEKNTQIQPITINLADGYYLDDTSNNDLKAKGLFVTKEGNQLTISGALKDNLTITLNAAPKQDGSAVVGNPTAPAVTYKEGLTLKDVKLPEGWTWSAPDTSLSVGKQSYEATFDTTGLEDTHTFEGVVQGYDEATHKVTRSLSVRVKEGDSTVTITTKSLDKPYDGKPVSVPEYTTSGSDGVVTIKWQVKPSLMKAKWIDLDAAPSDAGKYLVVVELAGNKNYKPAASEPLEFTISQAINEWEERISITGWTYGEEANKPTAKAKFGEVVFTYSSEENGEYTEEVPTNAGTYYVKASVAGNPNHTFLLGYAPFTIAKATPTPDKVTGLVLEQGQPLSKVKLPERFKWVDDTLTAKELGTHKFKVLYTPVDIVNYETVEVEVEVRVVPAPVEPNHVPTIHADDITLTVGDKFDPLKGVTATDKEDGTNVKLEVIKNTVDTTKAGTYEVVYKATDRDGATITKTIKVTVKAKNITVPDKDEDKDSSEHKAPETRDRTNLGMFASLLVISVFSLVALFVKTFKII